MSGGEFFLAATSIRTRRSLGRSFFVTLSILTRRLWSAGSSLRQQSGNFASTSASDSSKADCRRDFSVSFIQKHKRHAYEKASRRARGLDSLVICLIIEWI